MTDRYGREITYLRVSVTDRCNFRCQYCMPPEGVELLPHNQVLRNEEFLRLIRLFTELGVRHIRLTGGEPTVRRGFTDLVAAIHELPGVETIAVTSNGVLLPQMLPELLDHGLTGVNISLDSLQEDTFNRITRTKGYLPTVLEAVDRCLDAGLNTKLNCVAMKGVNDTEIPRIAALAKDRPLHVRFIEYMPIGKHDYEKAVYADDILNTLRSSGLRLTEDTSPHGNGPARYYKPEGYAGSVGVISAMSHCFCDTCNRVRMTSEGFLKLCLQYNVGANLRDPLREGASDEELKALILNTLDLKPRQHTFLDYREKEFVDDRDMSRIGG